MNENYIHPAMPSEPRDGILTRHVPVCDPSTNSGQAKKKNAMRQLFVIRPRYCAKFLAGADLARQRVEREQRRLWSVTSFNALQRDGVAARRWNLLHPEENRASRMSRSACGIVRPGRRVDRIHQDLRRTDSSLRRRRYVALGTDGYGCSDSAASCALSSRFRSPISSRSARWHALAEEGTLTGLDRAKGAQEVRDRFQTSATRSMCKGNLRRCPPESYFRSRAKKRECRMSSTIEVRVPDIGDFKDVARHLRLLVKPGDRVKRMTRSSHWRVRRRRWRCPPRPTASCKTCKVKVGDKVSQGMPDCRARDVYGRARSSTAAALRSPIGCRTRDAPSRRRTIEVRCS